MNGITGSRKAPVLPHHGIFLILILNFYFTVTFTRLFTPFNAVT